MISKSTSKAKSKAKRAGENTLKAKRKKSNSEVPQVKHTRKIKSLQLAVMNNRKITDYFLLETACDTKVETSGFESTASVLYLSAQDNENNLTNASTLQLDEDCSIVPGYGSLPKGNKQPVTGVAKVLGDVTSMTQEWAKFHERNMSVGIKEVIVNRTAEPVVGHNTSPNVSMDVEDDEESWEHFHQYNTDDCKLCRSRLNIRRFNMSSPCTEVCEDNSPTDSVIGRDFQELSADEQERQREEWKAELRKTEEEVLTLKQVLGAKEKHAAGLKRRLGITAWREFSEDMTQGLKNLQDSATYKRTAENIQIAKEIAKEKTSGMVAGITGSGYFQSMSSAFGVAKTKISSSMSQQSFSDVLKEQAAEEAFKQ